MGGHTIDHGPGMRFIPDGQGGGVLERMVPERRPGFRPGCLRVLRIRKAALRAP